MQIVIKRGSGYTNRGKKDFLNKKRLQEAKKDITYQ